MVETTEKTCAPKWRVPAKMSEVYKRNDLQPIRESWFMRGKFGGVYKTCACLLVACLIDAGMTREELDTHYEPDVYAQKVFGVNEDYVAGVICAWDEPEYAKKRMADGLDALPAIRPGKTREQNEEYMRGLVEGTEARLDVEREFSTIEVG